MADVMRNLSVLHGPHLTYLTIEDSNYHSSGKFRQGHGTETFPAVSDDFHYAGLAQQDISMILAGSAPAPSFRMSL